MQTGQQRATLNKETESVATLAPDAVIEDVVSHEVRDLGVHMYVTPPCELLLTCLDLTARWSLLLFFATITLSLVCSVHYTMASGERRTFRKFFKFQVSKPLEVKTKFHNVRVSPCDSGKALLWKALGFSLFSSDF